MAKDYGRKKSARQSGNISKQLLLVLVSFLFGYLSATVFDFTSLSSWVNRQLLAQNAAPLPVNNTSKQAQLLKPKFEFYTLLANERNEAAEQIANANIGAVAPTVPKPIAQAPTSLTLTKALPVSTSLPIVVAAKPVPMPSGGIRGTYLVQVAAFRSRQEAERMKASLVIKGFAVTITAASQQSTSWYRVNLGPFATRPEASKAQIAVARSEHIVGMIRKMDA